MTLGNSAVYLHTAVQTVLHTHMQIKNCHEARNTGTLLPTATWTNQTVSMAWSTCQVLKGL